MITQTNQRIIIIEPSTIVFAGLQSIIERMHIAESIYHVTELDTITQKLAQLRADIIIVNTAVFGFHKNLSIKSIFKDCTHASIIAFVSQYSDSQFLKQFDDIIDIYDDAQTISAKIRHIIEQDTIDITETDTTELSEREQEVLIAVVKGLINKEIASTLNISIHTVMSHRKNITRKTGIKSISGLTVYALFNNLIKQEDVQQPHH
ncbi:MAG: helix-turn-helix transcriptional regulator [Paludibacteraceae bacterium]|nr:helix-turn-helix transcriptional regulator [Paludibacteraceae bacterium]MBP9648626.1 helix-turn-helix transcriptional regulator [Paludibacteraceae bacterium]MBP9970541.1 helix-turn-helix transcriptional regulator [Paludibacteraceae bacterium]HNZ85977.1 LuxR C-terminal-related transcriptional regulator [Paludibacteraceae bacterium]